MKKRKHEKARTLLHHHPLLAKGGAHEKTRKSERRKAKMGLGREWGPQSARMTNAVPALFAV